MEIKVSFTPEEIELIRTVQTKSYCERIKCRDTAFCCGCPQQIEWEREVREIKKSPLWEYAVEYNSYLDKIEELKKLEQEKKQADELATTLMKKLLEQGILGGN